MNGFSIANDVMAMSNSASEDLSDRICIAEMDCLESILTTKQAHNIGSARAQARHADATQCENGSNRGWSEDSAEYAKWKVQVRREEVGKCRARRVVLTNNNIIAFVHNLTK